MRKFFLIAILMVMVLGISALSVSAQSDEEFISAFCAGEESVSGDLADVQDRFEEAPCPQHWRSGEAYWLDGAMYRLQFNYEGRFETLLFTEWDLLQEQLAAADAHGATIFVLSVLPQQNCSTFSEGDVVFNNALNGLYARVFDGDVTFSRPQGGAAFYFHEELQVITDDQGVFCREGVRDGNPIWYVYVTNGELTGWVSSHWVHFIQEFYSPSESDSGAHLAPDYQPVAAPWETTADGQTTEEAEATEEAETCLPLLADANFTIGTAVQVDSTAGLIRLRDGDNPDSILTNLDNGTEIVITGQPQCLNIHLSGAGWEDDFHIWFYPVVTLDGTHGIVAAQAADASQTYLSGE